MNFKHLLLAGAVALLSLQAFAVSDLNENGNTYTDLGACGGSVRLERTLFAGQLVLRVSQVQLCSNLSVDGRNVDLAKFGGYYSGDVRLDEREGQNVYNVRVRSNTGAAGHDVSFQVRSYVRPSQPSNTPSVRLSTFGQRFASLPSCGGSVELNVVNGSVNLVFRDVNQCSNFDILSNDGQGIDYPNKKLQGANQNRGGSFTLPKRVVDFGHNGVKVVVKSDTGKHSDIIYVQFLAL